MQGRGGEGWGIELAQALENSLLGAPGAGEAAGWEHQGQVRQQAGST
jgi:hypothetical protein